MITVFGATGTTGAPLVDTLLAIGASVRGVTSDPSKLDALKAKGCEAVAADFTDPAALARACDGAEKIYLVTPAHLDMRQWKANVIEAAKAGVTTGEWAAQMRAVHGEYRGPTGVSAGQSNKTEGLDDLRDAVDAVSDRLGRRLKFLVGKPGLDGHSNGAEQIAVRARDCGMDISYEGIRLTPAEIVEAAQAEEAHVVGLSILSGSHVPLVEDLMKRMRDAGLNHIPVIVGGIIPEADASRLRAAGVAQVYTPKDFELNIIMQDIITLADPTSVAAE